MRILHALRGLERTSGISTFLIANANLEAEAGYEVALLYERTFECQPTSGIKVFCGKSPEKISFRPDVVHVHAVWSLFSVRVMRWALRNNIPYVVSPHGCLMPRVFQRGRLKKWVFFNLLVKPLMRKAAALHVTALPEKEALASLGFRQDARIVPLGCDLPQTVQTRRNTALRTMLFVGRLGEEKGLVNLLRAWRQIDFPGWRLVIAGPDWLGHKAVLDEEVERLALRDNVVFPGSVVDDAKEAWYQTADCFVLPSPMENFSAVILEALAYGVPAIATKGTPWTELESEKCGWWIDQGIEPLIAALRSAMALSDAEREAMGLRGRQLAERRYSWGSVSEEMMEIYKELI